MTQLRQEELATKSLLEAIHLEAAYVSNGGDISSPMNPLGQWFALRYIENLHSQYEQSDKLALMKAIRACAYHGLIMPEWIVQDLTLAIDKVLSYEFKSWDEALGSPFPKNTNTNALKKKERLKFEVFFEARNILENNPDQPIDAGLYEKAGEKFHIQKFRLQNFVVKLKR